jgi:hypothetical protein
MNLDNWSSKYRKGLEEKALELSKLGSQELAVRVAVVLQVQDSCKDCAIETIKSILITGEDGLYCCDSCYKEIEDIEKDSL